MADGRLPGDGEINLVVDNLPPVLERLPRRLGIRSDPAVVVRDLVVIVLLQQEAIQFDDVGVLERR